MKCKLNITSKGEGFENEVGALGEINITENFFVLNYELDGDKCLLVYKDGTLSQTRQGSQNINMFFCQGKTTVCTLGLGDYTADLPLKCEKLAVENKDNFIILTLKYDCGGGDFYLRISVELDSQEKK